MISEDQNKKEDPNFNYVLDRTQKVYVPVKLEQFILLAYKKPFNLLKLLAKKKHFYGYYFLMLVCFIYLIVFYFESYKTAKAFGDFLIMFTKVVPGLCIVFLAVFVSNLIFRPSFVVKFLGKNSGFKKWLIAMASGSISSGPAFLWFPMLDNFKKRGVSPGFIVTFLGSKSTNLAVMPTMILFFGWEYSFILISLMFASAFIQGIIIDKIYHKH